MGDGSLQRFLCLVGGKKLKKKLLEYDFFFLPETLFGEKIHSLLSMSEDKNQIKLKYQLFFFLIGIGDNFISSEDSSSIEYTETGLSSN